MAEAIGSPQGVIQRFGFSKQPLNKATQQDLIECLQNTINEVFDVFSLDPALSVIINSGSKLQKRVLGNLVEIRSAILILQRPWTQRILGTYFPIQMESPDQFIQLIEHLMGVADSYLANLLGSVPSETGFQGGVANGFADPDDLTDNDPYPRVKVNTIW